MKRRRFYSFDGLGSVINLTDNAGASAASYHLDAWGNYRFDAEVNLSKNRFGFTGYLWDNETELYYANARFYDPELGRFISQDSYLGEADDPPSLHRYFYANANPGRFSDPDRQLQLGGVQGRRELVGGLHRGGRHGHGAELPRAVGQDRDRGGRRAPSTW